MELNWANPLGTQPNLWERDNLIKIKIIKITKLNFLKIQYWMIKKKIGVKKIIKKDWYQSELAFHTCDSGHETEITTPEKTWSSIFNQSNIKW
jgi:hypothetical protein